MQCEKTRQVHAFHDGELDAPAAAALEAHLADCPPCAALLADLRGLSRMIAAAPLRDMPDRAISRFHGAWHAAGDRGVLRIAGWLTAAAAALLLGAILRWPAAPPPGPVAHSSAWEISALTPPAAPTDAHAEGSSELVQVAQWMANDLSDGGSR